MKIKLSDVDLLYKLMLDMGMLTYLQQLMVLDEQTEMFGENEFEFVRVYTRNNLIDMQTETITKLKKLLDKSDFVISEK